MPVFSYLAYPVAGAKEALLSELAALDYCEATPADNQEILILVTDTPDENSVVPSRLGRSELPGAPPPIPHELQMRGNCIACRAGPGAVSTIRVEHS
jgi:hypothetical protein